MTNDPTRMNLGTLRSDMQLTLHTHQASRIWHGRTKAADRAQIIGLNGFVAIMNRMKRGSEQDDPYSDWWMLQVEAKLKDSKTKLQSLSEQTDHVLADVPPALTLGENLNVQPVRIPLYVGSQYGFLAVYLLVDYDNLVRRLILAHHTALIDRPTMDLWLDEGAHVLRSTFALAQKYRYSGAQRDDFAANNAVARGAIEKYGQLPRDVLEGTRRPRFAPPIYRRSPLNAMAATKEAPPAEAVDADATPAEIADADEPL